MTDELNPSRPALGLDVEEVAIEGVAPSSVNGIDAVSDDAVRSELEIFALAQPGTDKGVRSDQFNGAELGGPDLEAVFTHGIRVSVLKPVVALYDLAAADLEGSHAGGAGLAALALQIIEARAPEAGIAGADAGGKVNANLGKSGRCGGSPPEAHRLSVN